MLREIKFLGQPQIPKTYQWTTGGKDAIDTKGIDMWCILGQEFSKEFYGTY